MRVVSKFGWLVGIVSCALFLTAAAIMGPVERPSGQGGGAQDFCIAQWEWDTAERDFPHWRAPSPGNLLGSIDLRSVPAASQFGGTPQGHGFFSYDVSMAGSGMRCYGADLDRRMEDIERSATDLTLGFPIGTITAQTPRELIVDLLTTHADPTGQTFAKPVRGKLGQTVRLNLGGVGVVHEESFTRPHLDRTIAVFQADYRRNKAAGTNLESLQRWTGRTMLSLFGKLDETTADQLLPEEHRGDGFQEPRTTVGDTFVDAAGTSLDAHTATGANGGFSYTEFNGNYEIKTGDVVGLTTASVTAQGAARADSDLSSDDMYSEIEVVTLTLQGGQRVGAIARASDSVQTYYMVRLAGNSTIRLAKVLGGVFSDVAADRSITIGTLPGTVRIEVDDSTLQTFWRGTLEHDVTDTNITGNLRAGLTVQNDNVANSEGDNFEAADLAAPTPTPTPQPGSYGFWMSWPLHAVEGLQVGELQK